MSANRGRQKSLEKKKKRRVAARSAAAPAATSRAAIVKLAAACPFGPAFMTGEWRNDDADAPGLVSVLLTRELRPGTFVACSCLIDRTCLGVKDAFLRGPMSMDELEELVDRYDEVHPDGIEEVDVIEAQSVIFHALDYAARLGFSPHPDFAAALVGPRPETLIDTPLARPSRPRYLEGPHDDMARITRVLDRYWSERVLSDGAAGIDTFLHRIFELWLPEFHERFPEDLRRAHREYYEAVLGRPVDPERDVEAIEEHASSLPGTWAAFFRPMDDGRTGAELAKEFAPLRTGPLRDAVDRLGRPQLLFGDVIAVDRAAGIATVRDAFDGATRRVQVLPAFGRGLTRWTRLFGPIIELADGTYHHPSTLLGHAWLRNVAPQDFVARVNAALSELGHDPVDAAAPHAGLVRWIGVAHGVLRRMIAPTPTQAAAVAKKQYVVNSDGERFEFHEATLLLDVEQENKLSSALMASDDFVGDEEGFELLGTPRGKEVIANESLASLTPEEPGEWRVTANSASRYERVVDRLRSLCGRDVAIARLDVMRPWEAQPNCAAEESADTTRIVMASARAEVEDVRAGKATARAMILDASLRAIDEDVPAVGGKPRQVVKTPEGRARVESWLEEWELKGVPGEGGWAFVDLDPVRRELGLPTIA